MLNSSRRQEKVRKGMVFRPFSFHNVKTNPKVLRGTDEKLRFVVTEGESSRQQLLKKWWRSSSRQQAVRCNSCNVIDVMFSLQQQSAMHFPA